MITGLNPWISMWSRPRDTIRAVAYNHPTYGIYYLATIYALQGFFFYANWWSLGIQTHYLLYLSLAIVLSPLAGVLWLYSMGILYYLLGKLFHGCATPTQIRAAVAWSTIPYAITFFMWLLLLFWSPEAMFIQDTDSYAPLFIAFITLITKLWSFILTLQSIREVQHFSIITSLINVLAVSILTTLLFFFVFSWLRIVFG